MLKVGMFTPKVAAGGTADGASVSPQETPLAALRRSGQRAPISSRSTAPLSSRSAAAGGASQVLPQEQTAGPPLLATPSLPAGNRPISIPVQSQEVLRMSVHDEDSGQTTRRLVEKAELLEEKQTLMRRTYRTAVWLAVLLILSALCMLFLPDYSTTVTKRYDAKVGVELAVRGCDVDFVPGAEPTIAYTSLNKVSYTLWEDASGDESGSIVYAELSNTRGCGALRPGVLCRRVCLITVSVPPEASSSATFEVTQQADDLSTPTVRVRPQTTLHTLLVSPGQAPRSLMLQVKEAVITHGFTAKLGFGEMQVRDSVVPSASDVEAVFSMYLFGVSAAGQEDTPAIASGAACVVGDDAAGSDFATESRSSIDGVFSGFSSAAGEIVLTQNGDFRPEGSDGKPPTPHPRLVFSDGQRLTQTYGGSYGDRESTGTAYITFDIAGSDSVPSARFIYTTNTFFLHLAPASLQFLTAGVLVPPSFHEVLHFTGFDCGLPPGHAMSEATRNATLALMAAEITKFLHSDLEDEHPLRGTLVFTAEQGLEMPPFWGQPELYHFPVHGIGLTKPEVYSDSHKAALLLISIGLVLAVGLLFGTLMTYAVFMYISKVAQDTWVSEEADIQLVYAKRYGPEGDSKFKQQRALEGPERARPSANPFTEPFRLITKFTILPMRKKYIDSLAGFIDHSMRLIPTAVVVKAESGQQQVDPPNVNPPSQYIWMRDLLRQYELYCYDNALSVEASKTTIQRRLLTEYSVSIKMVTVSRLYCLRWKTGKELQTTIVHPPTNRPTSEAVVEAFIAARCTLDNEYAWLDLETRIGCRGTHDIGFRPALEAWAKRHDLPVPKLELGSTTWTKKALPPAVKVKLNMTAKQLRGLEYVHASEAETGWSWYVVEAATVVMHMSMYVVPLALALYTMNAQNYYSLYVCPPAPEGSDLLPLTWLDIFTLDAAEVIATRQTSLMTRLVIGEAMFFLLCTFVRQALNYMDVRRPSPAAEETTLSLQDRALSVLATVEENFNIFYSILVVLEIFFIWTFVGVVACWFLLATALDPTAFLPYGVAAVTVTTVATTMAADLFASAARIRTMLETAFNLMVASRISVVRGKHGGAGDGDTKEEGGEKGNEGGNGAEVSLSTGPEEIFDLIDREAGGHQGDGELTKEEFARLFKLLDLKLSTEKQDKLFALCDVDCSGSISREEFISGWTAMVSAFTAEGATAVGLGQMQILTTVVYVIITLGLAIGFILVTLAAWSNGDTFGAVVQSSLVAGVGKTSSSARSKSDAEDPEKSEELTKELMSQENMD